VAKEIVDDPSQRDQLSSEQDTGAEKQNQEFMPAVNATATRPHSLGEQRHPGNRLYKTMTANAVDEYLNQEGFKIRRLLTKS
jgi:hypothetical protein